jgi:hypothetical protein
LEWLQENEPEHLALIVYLFVIGELVDAYQNWFVTVVERVQMVLQAYFFLELWQIFIETAGYSMAKHFISPQCMAIMKRIIFGFLCLVIIYRDYGKTKGGDALPFLPWLYSTEVAEHVFGICRQLIKDFTMLDFYFMVPKIFVML